jgi:transcriptional regulator with XRE-family HTH domain
MLSGMPQVNGRLIRGRRQRLGIKLGEFAKRAGVGYKTLANIESGLSDGSPYSASIEVVYRIADALGMDADDLLVKSQQGAAA